MRVILQILACLFLLTGCFLSPVLKHHISVDCHILNSEGELLRKYQGRLCVFLEDGSYISTTQKAMTRRDKFGRVLWSIDKFIHHELSLSPDKTKFFYITTDYLDYLGKLTRFDVLNISDLEGKIIKQYRLFDHKEEILKLSDVKFEKTAWHMPDEDNYPGAPYEFSHVNSIQEIPENKLGQTNTAFKQGNFIVSFNGLGLILILDHELKNILWSRKAVNKSMFSSHNVLVIPNGNILYFNNINGNPDDEYTSIDEINPLTNEIVWQFKLVGSNFKINKLWGGCQLMEDGNLLITENSTVGKIIVVGRDKKIKREFVNHYRYSKAKEGFYWYRANHLDLTKYLKNSIN